MYLRAPEHANNRCHPLYPSTFRRPNIGLHMRMCLYIQCLYIQVPLTQPRSMFDVHMYLLRSSGRCLSKALMRQPNANFGSVAAGRLTLTTDPTTLQTVGLTATPVSTYQPSKQSTTGNSPVHSSSISSPPSCSSLRSPVISNPPRA